MQIAEQQGQGGRYLGIAGQTGDGRARFPFPAPIIWMPEALLVKRGEESIDQADEFILEFRRTKER